MATYYVNKSGNDSDTGLTPALAKLTIQGGLNAMAASGDTLIVQSGVYSEAVIRSTSLAGTILADGFVIMDGESTLGTGINFSTNVVTASVKGFIVRRYNTAGATSHSAPFSDCMFDLCGIGLDIVSSTSNLGPPTRCVFVDCTTGLRVVRSTAVMKSLTFFGCATAALCTDTLASQGFRLQNCIFDTNTIHIQVNGAGSMTATSNGNCINFSTGKCVFIGVDKLTLAAWQSASGADAASISANPVFVSPTDRLLGLKPTSPCLVNGLLSVADRVQGAYNRKIATGDGTMDGAGPNASSSVWNRSTDVPAGTAVATNLTKDGSGRYILSAGFTTGTLELVWPSTGAVIMSTFSPTRKVGRLFLRQRIFYPLGVLDNSTADSVPNRLKYEYATDTGAGFGALTAIEPDSYIDDPAGFRELSPATTIQRLKVKVTFRKDGTAA